MYEKNGVFIYRCSHNNAVLSTILLAINTCCVVVLKLSFSVNLSNLLGLAEFCTCTVLGGNPPVQICLVDITVVHSQLIKLK